MLLISVWTDFNDGGVDALAKTLLFSADRDGHLVIVNSGTHSFDYIRGLGVGDNKSSSEVFKKDFQFHISTILSV
jgi:hypothetical protein